MCTFYTNFVRIIGGEKTDQEQFLEDCFQKVVLTITPEIAEQTISYIQLRNLKIENLGSFLQGFYVNSFVKIVSISMMGVYGMYVEFEPELYASYIEKIVNNEKLKEIIRKIV